LRMLFSTFVLAWSRGIFADAKVKVHSQFAEDATRRFTVCGRFPKNKVGHFHCSSPSVDSFIPSAPLGLQ
jgi:hypothetical protein